MNDAAIEDVRKLIQGEPLRTTKTKSGKVVPDWNYYLARLSDVLLEIARHLEGADEDPERYVNMNEEERKRSWQTLTYADIMLGIAEFCDPYDGETRRTISGFKFRSVEGKSKHDSNADGYAVTVGGEVLKRLIAGMPKEKAYQEVARNFRHKDPRQVKTYYKRLLKLWEKEEKEREAKDLADMEEGYIVGSCVLPPRDQDT
jgi:hypothetical protein